MRFLVLLRILYARNEQCESGQIHSLHLAYMTLKHIEIYLNVLQNIKIHCVFIYSFGSLQTLSRVQLKRDGTR